MLIIIKLDIVGDKSFLHAINMYSISATSSSLIYVFIIVYLELKIEIVLVCVSDW